MASGGHSSSRCAGLSLSCPLLLWSAGSRRAGSVIVAHGPSCSAACGILPDQGSTRVPCIGRQILNHCATREAPVNIFFLIFIYYLFIMFIFGCVGSSFLCEGFLQLRRVGATLHRGARAGHYRGLSCCGAEAPDAQAQ